MPHCVVIPSQPYTVRGGWEYSVNPSASMACTWVTWQDAADLSRGIAVVFGKKGRPLEDRLARQKEIYAAVSPLILQDGARQLSMRHAAWAACLSIGGLYHYFPTKRDLLLHGLCPEVTLRHCQNFHAQFGYLADLDPERYIVEGITFIVNHVRFCRPAIHAALELGVESFWEVIDTVLTNTALDFEMRLHRMVPQMSEQELHRCGRAVRRSWCAALLDKTVAPDELRDELRILIDGYMSRIGRSEQTLADAESA